MCWFLYGKLETIKQNIHRGKILQAAVNLTGINKEIIARKAGYERVTYYSHIKRKDLSLEILAKYAKALGHDFSDEIEGFGIAMVADAEAPYLGAPATIEEAIRQRDFYVKLYWEKLEQYRKLEDELKELKLRLSKKL
jgi:hypothetical protein